MIITPSGASKRQAACAAVLGRLARRSLLALSMGLLAPSASIAERSDDILALSVEELINIPVFSASKRAQKAEQAPAAVYVITKDDIRRFGYRTLSEALRMVSGFYLSTDRNYDYLGVRGFSRPYDLNTRVLLLLDGHRLNDPNFDYAPLGEDLPVDLDALERVEVIKGPGSALWGTNALFAIINLVTKRGADLRGAEAHVDFGSHERVKISAAGGRKLANGLDYSASAGFSHSNGESEIFYPGVSDPLSGADISRHEDGEKAFRGLARVAYEDFSLFVNANMRRKEIPTGSFGTSIGSDDNYTWDGSFRVEGAFERPLETIRGASLLTRAYYDKVRYYGDYVYATEEGRALFRDRGSSDLVGAEARYSQAISSSFSFIAGAEVQRAFDLELEYSQREPVGRGVLDTEDDFHIESFYVEADYALIEQLHLIAGLRLDHYSTFDEELSPRAALVYSPFSDTTFKLLYGEAFRAPNNFERNYDDAQSLVGNPDLDPEKVRSFEAVAERRFGESTVASLSLFRFEARDIITQVMIPDGLQFRNTDEVTSKGVELQINTHLASGLSTYVAGSLLDAEDRATDARASNSPRRLLNAGVSIPFWERRIFVSPEIQYLGDRVTRSGAVTGGTTVTNVNLLTETGLEGLTFSFAIYNVFDKQMVSPGAGEHRQEVIPHDDRTFRARFDYRF